MDLGRARSNAAARQAGLLFGAAGALTPLAAAAYMVPGLVDAQAPDGALSSVTVAIPPAC